jgi:glutamate 5-kinase
MVLAHGGQKGVLTDIVHGRETGTLFLPKAKLSARFRWVAYAGKSKGKLYVDQGAQNALCIGKKSLLSSGIVKVSGDFQKGDVVSVADVHGCDFARGLANYASGEVNKIKGLNSERIKAQLRRDAKPEVIHRDNIVLLSA